jgi:chromosome segregation ATPase
VQEHDDAIVRADAMIDKNAAIADDSLKAVQASLKASLASLRDEMNRKLQALTIEIAQLQKQVNVSRGEQSIIGQQTKDLARKVDVVTATVSELSAEIVGDEAAPALAAASAAAGDARRLRDERRKPPWRRDERRGSQQRDAGVPARVSMMSWGTTLNCPT